MIQLLIGMARASSVWSFVCLFHSSVFYTNCSLFIVVVVVDVVLVTVVVCCMIVASCVGVVFVRSIVSVGHTSS